MWAVRAFVVKTLSGHSRHTHVHTVDTGIFPSCFDALRWGVRLGWVAWPCQWERFCFVFVFLPPALSHTLIDSFFSYSLSHALDSFLSLAGSVLQTKWNLAHLQRLLNCHQIRHSEQMPVCSLQIGVWSLNDAHARWGSFGIVVWKNTMEMENSENQRMHTKKHTPSHDFVGELTNKSWGQGW